MTKQNAGGWNPMIKFDLHFCSPAAAKGGVADFAGADHMVCVDASSHVVGKDLRQEALFKSGDLASDGCGVHLQHHSTVPEDVSAVNNETTSVAIF